MRRCKGLGHFSRQFRKVGEIALHSFGFKNIFTLPLLVVINKKSLLFQNGNSHRNSSYLIYFMNAFAPFPLYVLIALLILSIRLQNGERFIAVNFAIHMRIFGRNFPTLCLMTSSGVALLSELYLLIHVCRSISASNPVSCSIRRCILLNIKNEWDRKRFTERISSLGD